MLLVILAGLSFTASAQDVIVKVRPEIPRYERIVAPSPRHVWIEEEWESRGGRYVFTGGHWAVPPHAGWMWIPGHWKQHPRGWFWTPGHWARR